MKARIYKPARSSMQSGFARTSKWILEIEPSTARTPDPMMGWVSGGDTGSQVVLKFDTLAAAESYAKDNSLEYTVLNPRSRRVLPRNYVDNFKYVPPETHEKKGSAAKKS